MTEKILEPKTTRSGKAYFTCHPCNLDVMVPGISVVNIFQPECVNRLGVVAAGHLENHKE